MPIHIEILLPSFCLGMITDEHDEEIEHDQNKSIKEINDMNEDAEHE